MLGKSLAWQGSGPRDLMRRPGPQLHTTFFSSPPKRVLRTVCWEAGISQQLNEDSMRQYSYHVTDKETEAQRN
jgi:hypothetical protein